MATDILVIGLGKLGLPLAAVWAEAGFSVLGYDQDVGAVIAANDGKPRFPEPGLEDSLKANAERLYFTNTLPNNIQTTKAIFIVVPTPTGEDGRFSSEYIEDVLQLLDRLLNRRAVHQPAICVVSTVFPGTMRRLADAYPHMRLFYTPTMIALGRVMKDLVQPDFQLVGCAGEQDEDGMDLERLFNQLHGIIEPKTFKLDITDSEIGLKMAGYYCRFMSYESAEVAKLAANTFVTMKITFANRIGEMCLDMEDADAEAILDVIGSDHRIGYKALKAGAPYGGPCFPRDVEAMAQIDPLLGWSIHKMNEDLVRSIAKRAHDACPPDKAILIMGVTYKPGLPVLDGSPSMAVHAELTRLYQRKCYLWDPCGPLDENPDWLASNMTWNEIPEGTMINMPPVGALVLMHPTYGEGSIAAWIERFEGPIIDPWHQTRKNVDAVM